MGDTRLALTNELKRESSKIRRGSLTVPGIKDVPSNSSNRRKSTLGNADRDIFGFLESTQNDDFWQEMTEYEFDDKNAVSQKSGIMEQMTKCSQWLLMVTISTILQSLKICQAQSPNAIRPGYGLNHSSLANRLSRVKLHVQNVFCQISNFDQCRTLRILCFHPFLFCIRFGASLWSIQNILRVRVDDVGDAARFAIWRLYATVCAMSNFGRFGRFAWRFTNRSHHTYSCTATLIDTRRNKNPVFCRTPQYQL